MTSPIGISAVFADVAVLLALAAAVASPRVSRVARLVIATFGFASAWLMTAALDATRAPDWTIFTGGAVIAASIVVVIASLHVWTGARDAGEIEPRHRGDEGGGGPRRHRPDAPQPGGGGSDPPWWPEFEHRLAVYVAEHQRAQRQPAVLRP